MDMICNRRCNSCGKDIEECRLCDLWAVTCEYADIMLYTVFMLYKTGWLKSWLQREGYQVLFGYVSLQKWLNRTSDLGGINQNQVVEAFEAYAMEVRELE
jgi:hypothetical protein